MVLFLILVLNHHLFSPVKTKKENITSKKPNIENQAF